MRRSMASSFLTSDLFFGSSPEDLASRSADGFVSRSAADFLASRSVVGFFAVSSAEDFFFVACSAFDFDELSSRANTAALLTLSIRDAISSVDVMRPPRRRLTSPALRWKRDAWPLEGMSPCRRMQSPIGMK